MLFRRTRTLTPGGHPGGGITVRARGDGIVIRITDPARGWYEAFLDTAATDNLVDVLTDDPTDWGWQPREELASRQRCQDGQDET
ncbi:hypothetical protein GO011_09150 [Mycobacterium sp. 20091114027_K0903767]|nr:hypothetical protein [Mycobacterium sp. 20091114027_K0903767]